MSTERRYEYLYGEALFKLMALRPLAWVPLGILEKHGEHLPWGLDGLKAHGICLRLAQRLGGVVLPATHLAGVHEPWVRDPAEYKRRRADVGNFYLREETLRALLRDTVEGLANIGFKMIVLYSGHYPKLQIQIMDEAARQATAEGLAEVIGFTEPEALGDGDHAGKWETSLYLGLGGEARLDRLSEEQKNKVGYWSERNPPAEATRAFGEEALKNLEAWFRPRIEAFFGA